MPYLFIVFIFVAQCILFLAHFAAYKLALAAFSLTSVRAILLLRVIFIVLSLSFIIASLVSFKSSGVISQSLYIFSVVWLGFLFYLLVASLIYYIFSAIFPDLNFLPELGKVLIAFALLSSAFGILNASTLRTTRISPKFIVPEIWQGRKIVFISDIHVGQVIGRSFVENLVKKINDVSPDLVLIGGDFFDGTGVDIELVTEPLGRLSSQFGTYFVTGNHEEFEDPTKYFDAIRSRGIKILNNEFVELDGLQIVGVDFKATVGVDNFQQTLMSIKYDHNKPTLLLKHTPLNLDVAQAMNIDFQISGHTHRAQMFPLNLITHLVYKGYDYGLKQYKSMSVYTSSGAGTWGPPLKIGAPSEIVLINL